jgi:hypothetical protein
MSTKQAVKAAVTTTNLLRPNLENIRASILGFELSKGELKEHLGVGNVAPRGAPTNQAWRGWNGKAFYHFVAADCLTPYLTNIQQMNNWNYVLFKIPRIAVERKDETEPVDLKIRSVVDRHSKR